MGEVKTTFRCVFECNRSKVCLIPYDKYKCVLPIIADIVHQVLALIERHGKTGVPFVHRSFVTDASGAFGKFFYLRRNVVPLFSDLGEKCSGASKHSGHEMCSIDMVAGLRFGGL